VKAQVLKVVVTDLRENTFYAAIHLRLGSTDVTVDSRPSDAIALALRVDAPVFVEEAVLAKAESVEVKVKKDSDVGAGKVDDPAQIKEWLDSLKPGDFDTLEHGKDPGRPDE
jgi:bifunctional DNase/RNase